LKVGAIYSLVIAGIFGFSLIRARLLSRVQAQAQQPVFTDKPFFSLTTNRTFAPGERARVWASYNAVDYLDFRVYQVNDPVKFFRQLENPHQVGENEKVQMASDRNRLSLLERTHSLKFYIYSAIKDYVRAQLQHDHREQFNQKFRPQEKQEGPRQTPLNVADYARVPLLNSNQKVSDWREKLPPIANEYEQTAINLGQRKPGVYLVEAVNGDLRAYSITIVTELTMVQKTTRDGQVVVYVVDRKTGAPHANVSVEVTKGKDSLATGTTDKSGLFQAEIRSSAAKEQTAPKPVENDSEAGKPAYLITAHERDNFVISDVDSFYFNDGEESEDEEGGGYNPNLVSYIYTDRPVYRPAQKVYFKGILRQWGRNGYELVNSKTVTVTIENPDSGKVLERELPMSSRGTFSGEVDIADEAPLGSWHIRAKAGSSTTSAYFEVQEYKKPEFKVKVTGPQPFASVGEKVRFGVEARYFFGAPVTKAEVHYYIYRSRYYHSWWVRPSEDFDDAAGPDNEGGMN
jgi:uncharacterized protein YfaS (alpha-2-macroglobulin family)